MGPKIVSINGKDFEIQDHGNGLTRIVEHDRMSPPLFVVEGEVTTSHARNLLGAYFIEEYRKWVDGAWAPGRFPCRGREPGADERYGQFVVADSYGGLGNTPDEDDLSIFPGVLEFSAAYSGKAPPELIMLDGVPYTYHTSSGDHRSAGVHFYCRVDDDSVIQLDGMGT